MSCNIKDESRIVDSFEFSVPHLVHRLTCSCSRPKNFAMGEVSANLSVGSFTSAVSVSGLVSIGCSVCSFSVSSAPAPSTLSVSGTALVSMIFLTDIVAPVLDCSDPDFPDWVSLLSCCRMNRAQLCAKRGRVFFRLISGCVSGRRSPIAAASGSVRNALRKLAGCTTIGWPFWSRLRPISSMWNKKDNSQARQNSRLHRCSKSWSRRAGM